VEFFWVIFDVDLVEFSDVLPLDIFLDLQHVAWNYYQRDYTLVYIRGQRPLATSLYYNLEMNHLYLTVTQYISKRSL
jgi:hypothetical protein